jgi:hypothetical protein
LRGLVPVSRAAMEYMEKFSQNLLLHVNPYTGMAVKDDPALISVEMLNENSLYFVLGEKPEMLAVYQRKCMEYLRQKNGKDPRKEDIELFMPEFIVMMQEKGTRELKAYLRSIGVQKPITDISYGHSISLTPSRQQLDYVDIHAYWDLAEGLPTRLHLRNPIEGKWRTQIEAGASRLFGKPFSQGEYNTVYPSPYWAYVAPSEAAIAGLQNWSMIIGFSAFSVHTDHVFKPYPAMGVKSCNPMIMLTERIGSILFKNNEVLPSKIKIPYVVTKEYINSKTDIKGGLYHPGIYDDLGLICQIGTVILENETDLSQYPCVVIPQDMKIPDALKKIKFFPADSLLRENLKTILPGLDKNIFSSTTGQGIFDPARKSSSIITPKAECFMLPDELDKIQGNNVLISGNKTISTCFVASRDKLPINESKRLLALYVTDLKNTGTVVDYEKNSGAVFQKLGTMPFLLRQGEIIISVKTKNPGIPKIWALKYDGSRSEIITPKKSDGGLSFSARAVTNKDTYFAYEIIWE